MLAHSLTFWPTSRAPSGGSVIFHPWTKLIPKDPNTLSLPKLQLPPVQQGYSFWGTGAIVTGCTSCRPQWLLADLNPAPAGNKPSFLTTKPRLLPNTILKNFLSYWKIIKLTSSRKISVAPLYPASSSSAVMLMIKVPGGWFSRTEAINCRFLKIGLKSFTSLTLIVTSAVYNVHEQFSNKELFLYANKQIIFSSF